MHRYIKDTSRLMVKFVQETSSEIILEVPSTALELHDYFKGDYITSILKNTFGDEKLKTIGNVIIVIDQKFLLQS